MPPPKPIGVPPPTSTSVCPVIMLRTSPFLGVQVKALPVAPVGAGKLSGVSAVSLIVISPFAATLPEIVGQVSNPPTPPAVHTVVSVKLVPAVLGSCRPQLNSGLAELAPAAIVSIPTQIVSGLPA